MRPETDETETLRTYTGRLKNAVATTSCRKTVATLRQIFSDAEEALLNRELRPNAPTQVSIWTRPRTTIGASGDEHHHIKPAPFREVASGLAAPEGPVPLPDGSVLVVEVLGGCLTRISADGDRRVVAMTGRGPNGAAIGPDGHCYVFNNGGIPFIEREGKKNRGSQSCRVDAWIDTARQS